MAHDLGPLRADGMASSEAYLHPVTKYPTRNESGSRTRTRTQRKNNPKTKIALTNLPRHIRIQPRKHHHTPSKPLRLTPPHHQLPHIRRYRIDLFPGYCFRVGFPRRTGGGAEGGDEEVGVGGEEGDEALADGAGGAEDADGDFLAFGDHCSVCECRGRGGGEGGGGRGREWVDSGYRRRRRTGRRMTPNFRRPE